MEDNYVTLYHGTAKANAARIEKEGLKPGAGLGADKWAAKHKLGVAEESAKRHPSVYVTRNKYQASQFAYYSAEVNNDKATLLELRVPKSDFAAKFKRDEESLAPVDYRSEEAIPPAWIIGEITPDPKIKHDPMLEDDALLHALLNSIFTGGGAHV